MPVSLVSAGDSERPPSVSNSHQRGTPGASRPSGTAVGGSALWRHAKTRFFGGRHSPCDRRMRRWSESRPAGGRMVRSQERAVRGIGTVRLLLGLATSACTGSDVPYSSDAGSGCEQPRVRCPAGRRMPRLRAPPDVRARRLLPERELRLHVDGHAVSQGLLKRHVRRLHRVLLRTRMRERRLRRRVWDVQRPTRADLRRWADAPDVQRGGALRERRLRLRPARHALRDWLRRRGVQRLNPDPGLAVVG